MSDRTLDHVRNVIESLPEASEEARAPQHARHAFHSLPRSNARSHPRSKSPSPPRSKSPSPPRSKSPSPPRSKSPSPPRSKSPSAPRSKSPSSPRSKWPTPPSSGSLSPRSSPSPTDYSKFTRVGFLGVARHLTRQKFEPKRRHPRIPMFDMGFDPLLTWPNPRDVENNPIFNVFDHAILGDTDPETGMFQFDDVPWAVLPNKRQDSTAYEEAQEKLTENFDRNETAKPVPSSSQSDPAILMPPECQLDPAKPMPTPESQSRPSTE